MPWGVCVCAGPEEALQALHETMADQRFGAAGERVVIEERLEGEEVSYYAVSDGEHIVSLAAAQDHKRALDGDRGENTGGMGAYSPAPVLRPDVEKRVLEEIVHPTIRGMASEGTPYVGVLFVGLMIDASGAPRVVEFNVRFGDPETQPLMMRMRSSLTELLDACADGDLSGCGIDWHDGAAACIVMAARGYPGSYDKGARIAGIEEAERDPQTTVFHAGSSRDADGCWRTAGGRVLGVTASGASIADAVDRAYAGVGKIRWEGAHFRRDIGHRAIAREVRKS